MKNKYWIVAAVAAVVCFSSPVSGWAVSPLDSAESFAVLAGNAISISAGTSSVTGDIGAGASITGTPVPFIGTSHVGDSAYDNAWFDAYSLYTLMPYIGGYAAPLTGDLGGMTLTQGAYQLNDATLVANGILQLDGQNDDHAWWIFLINGSLTTGANSSVNIVNALNAGNDYGLYWRLGGAATLGANTTFQGNIMAWDSITLGDTALIPHGRALSFAGSVNLGANSLINQSTPLGSPGYSGGDFFWFEGYGDPIPEPATLSLLGLGLLGLAFRKKK